MDSGALHVGYQCIIQWWVGTWVPGISSGVEGEAKLGAEREPTILKASVGECGSGLSSGERYWCQYSGDILSRRSTTYHTHNTTYNYNNYISCLLLFGQFS